MHRNLLLLAALAVPAAVHARAPQAGVENPRAFVAQMYERYRTTNDAPVAEPRYAYSARLTALFAAYDAWARGHDDVVGSIDFDWWTNAQDWQLSDVAVTQRPTGLGRMTVTARFRNADRREEIRFLFVRWRGRWYLDDAVEGSGYGRDGWTLSALLRQREQ